MGEVKDITMILAEGLRSDLCKCVSDLYLCCRLGAM